MVPRWRSRIRSAAPIICGPSARRPVDGEAFLIGASEYPAFPPDLAAGPGAVASLCEPTPWGTRPLCPLIARRAQVDVLAGFDGALDDVDELSSRLRLSGPLRLGLIRGVGRILGEALPPAWRPMHELDGWSASDRAALEDGLLTGGRSRWHWSGDLDSMPPWHHP